MIKFWLAYCLLLQKMSNRKLKKAIPKMTPIVFQNDQNFGNAILNGESCQDYLDLLYWI